MNGIRGPFSLTWGWQGRSGSNGQGTRTGDLGAGPKLKQDPPAHYSVLGPGEELGTQQILHHRVPMSEMGSDQALLPEPAGIRASASRRHSEHSGSWDGSPGGAGKLRELRTEFGVTPDIILPLKTLQPSRSTLCVGLDDWILRCPRE